MVAAGNTNAGLGLQVGWMSLAGGGPFTVPTPPQPGRRIQQGHHHSVGRAQHRGPLVHPSASQIDARQEKTCDNIKAAGITLYTIQVNTGHDPTSTLLQNCASDPSMFYLLTSSGQILATLSYADSHRTG